jgi:hypothetical protein
MVKIVDSNERVSLEVIKNFETEYNVNLPERYKGFLLNWNGGYPEPSLFKISDEKGVSVLDHFYGIGDDESGLCDYIDIYEYRLPTGFVPIANDPGGNVICLGTNESYYDNIYFWDHENEQEDNEDMSNMYFLANNIDEFLGNLYEDEDN